MVERIHRKAGGGRRSVAETEAGSRSASRATAAMKHFLITRRMDLEDLAKKSGLDVAARLLSLPQGDEVVIVAALATALGLDARAALNPLRSLEDLTANRK